MFETKEYQTEEGYFFEILEKVTSKITTYKIERDECNCEMYVPIVDGEIFYNRDEILDFHISGDMDEYEIVEQNAYGVKYTVYELLK
jgi:hypothetical protein